MKARASPSVQQVNQFELELLLLQRPIEKEDVRAVVFNDQDAGGANTNEVSFNLPPRRPILAGPFFIIPQSMAAPLAATPVWPLRSTAWAQALRSRKGNKSPLSARFPRRSEYPNIVGRYHL
jgi:hypothetical protein